MVPKEYSLGGETVKDTATDEEKTARLAQQVDKAHSFIKIVAGEACYKIYDRQEVREAFQNAKERGVYTTMVAGPIFSARSKNELPVMLILAKEGVVELYSSVHRRPIHYRIWDENSHKDIYIEAPHEALAEQREIIEIDNKNFWIANLENEFDKLIKDDEEVKLVTDPQEDFLILTKEEIDYLKQAAADSGRELDLMSKEDFQRLLNQRI